ncbi:chaperone protein ClpB3, chloroplastic-like [Helianthus annuus]|uniref:chaperone protein ClpB3, chloroplastic-like n=1 Tax=Helianthus annuus TaxID=4232 RepID=UPI00165307BC|nr:chaperone protein ClpB3, chloroplastic-like [Helianthus annuus]
MWAGSAPDDHLRHRKYQRHLKLNINNPFHFDSLSDTHFDLSLKSNQEPPPSNPPPLTTHQQPPSSDLKPVTNNPPPDLKLVHVSTAVAAITSCHHHLAAVTSCHHHQPLSPVKKIDRVKQEMEAAERDCHLNRAVELKYGTLMTLQLQLEEAERNLSDYQHSANTLIKSPTI